jgi:aspartate aminotransferase-like enzyme
MCHDFSLSLEFSHFEQETILKKRLFTPGPTSLPQEVIQAMTKPIVHHRGQEFIDLFRQVQQGLQYVFQTQNEILILTCSGTGAMEACVANLHCPGDQVLVVRGGKFAERWDRICQAYGLQVKPIDIPWGEAVDPQRVAKSLEEEPNIKVVYATLCETSTGVVHDLSALARIVGPHSALLVVDAISALGADELLTDVWGLDVVISAAQNGLLCPPGISFVSLNDSAWDRVKSATLPRFYWDFREMRRFSEKNMTPYTPAITTLYGLRAALNIIQREGLEKIIERHARLARITRAAITAMNLKLFSQRPSSSLTAVQVPQGIDGTELLRLLSDEHGIVVADGQFHLKGKIFRLAHLGDTNELDVIAAIAALEKSLLTLGHEFSLGAGLRAAKIASSE